MKKRHIIQVFLVSSIFILIFFTYFPTTEKTIVKFKQIFTLLFLKRLLRSKLKVYDLNILSEI